MRTTPALLIPLLAIMGTLGLSAAAQAGDNDNSRTLAVVNRAHDSLTALAMSPAGQDDYRDVPLARSVQGGGDATTVNFDGGHCRYDLRMQFRDGRRMVYTNVDVCRLQSLRIDPPRKGDDGTRLARD